MIPLVPAPKPAFWLAALLAAVSACSSVPRAEKVAAAPAIAGEDVEQKSAIARDKLALVKLQAEIAGTKAEGERARKERELELARAELAQFDDVDAPSRLARAQLELARHQDALFEQQEELAQLEMMYEKEDLADKTREIVLQRGKRRVDRAKADLAIVEKETKGLESRTLPRERSKLALDADTKARELAGLDRDKEATVLEKRIAVQSAESEVRAAEAKAGSKP